MNLKLSTKSANATVEITVTLQLLWKYRNFIEGHTLVYIVQDKNVGHKLTSEE